MAKLKVSELTTAANIGTSDFLYVVQNFQSKKITIQDLFRTANIAGLSGPPGPAGPEGPQGLQGNTTVALPLLSWVLVANGSSSYTFSGPGIHANIENNPSLYLYKGLSYELVNLNNDTHPIQIRYSANSDPFTIGVESFTREIPGTTDVNSGVRFTVPMDAPATLYYQCNVHPAMGNVLYIV